MNTPESSPPAPAPAVAPAARATAFPAWVGPLGFAVAVVALFWDTFATLITLWERDQNYTHGYLVVPVSLGIAAWLFVKRPDEPGTPDRRLGWIALVCAGVCHLLAVLVNYAGIDFLALFFVVRGGLMFSGNRQWAARFNFPLAFLIFMFPLPPQWLNWVALRLQDIAARVSETVLGLFVEVIRNGHNIRIAGMPSELVVAEECSGTRQMVAFVAMAALVGFFTSKNGWYRILLLVASVPVAVFANVLRVVLMNVGAYWFGTGWLGGWLHHAPAVFTLPIGFLLFLAIDRTLQGLFGKKEATPPVTPVPATADAGATPTPATPVPATAKEKAPPPPLPADFGRRWLVAAAVVAGLVGLTMLFQWHIAAGGKGSYPENPGKFAQVPYEFAADDKTLLWRGEEIDRVREETRKKLPFDADDLSYRGYQTVDGRYQALVYMVHSEIGEDRKHHPEICIREVSGAPEVAGGRKAVSLLGPDGPQDGPKAQRFRFSTGGGRSMAVYYWHYSVRPNDGQLDPVQRVHQAVGTGKPSVTVQLTTAGDDSRGLELVERTLLPQLHAALTGQVLPPNTAAGCDRLPVVFVR
jgi:exosortase